MTILLAVITSGLWGTSDFFGGLASRKEPVERVILWAHGIGLVGVAAIAPFLADQIIARDLALGAIAGVIGVVGMLLLYWSLSAGPMAVVAPLSALSAAALPVSWQLAQGNQLTGLTLVGLLIGLAAVVAISWESESKDGDADAPQLTAKIAIAAVFAGLCFGSIVLFYQATSEASAPWPVVSGRLATTSLLLGFALLTRRPITPGKTLGLAAVAGIGDTLANVTLLLASTTAVGTELSVVAVLTAFYPAATVLWARFFLHERLGPIRVGGLALGLVAIALLTLG